MTSIAVWAGVDTHGVASLYVASDSRISWGNSYRWDQGRKVFACGSEPHIFGYWGDVLFPALCLPVLVDRIDHGLLVSTAPTEHQEVLDALRSLWSGYPDQEKRDLGIVHAFRVGNGTECVFNLAIITYDKNSDSWDIRQAPMPPGSAVLQVAGSGTQAVRRSLDLWQMSDAAGTSRAIFSAFCESVAGSRDPYTGGAPQLVGLYRIGAGRLFGFIQDGQRYVTGAKLSDSEAVGDIEWRNNIFERVDGRSGARLPGAQRHTDRPKGARLTALGP